MLAVLPLLVLIEFKLENQRWRECGKKVSRTFVNNQVGDVWSTWQTRNHPENLYQNMLKVLYYERTDKSTGCFFKEHGTIYMYTYWQWWLYDFICSYLGIIVTFSTNNICTQKKWRNIYISINIYIYTAHKLKNTMKGSEWMTWSEMMIPMKLFFSTEFLYVYYRLSPWQMLVVAYICVYISSSIDSSCIRVHRWMSRYVWEPVACLGKECIKMCKCCHNTGTSGHHYWLINQVLIDDNRHDHTRADVP